jgi:hypothetical protein
MNQRLDKLAAARVDFTSRRMLDGTVISSALQFHGISHLSFNYLTEAFSTDDFFFLFLIFNVSVQNYQHDMCASNYDMRNKYVVGDRPSIE